MIRSAKHWWVLYGVCVILVFGALLGLSRTLFELQGKEHLAQVKADQSTAAGYALYRLDLTMNPFILEETGRPYFEYQSFFPNRRPYSGFFNELEVGDLMTASPLLTYQSDFVRIHFQIDSAGTISSPRAPEDHMRQGAIQGCVTENRVDQSRKELLEIVPFLRFDALWAQVSELERAESAVRDETQPVAAYVFGANDDFGKNEYQKRSKSAIDVKKNAQIAAQSQTELWNASPSTRVEVGALVPLWLEHPEKRAPKELFLLRCVESGEHRVLQGISLRWEVLKERLLLEVRDLLQAADLKPLEGASRDPMLRLATLPVELLPGPLPEVPPAVGRGPVRGTLLINWLAVVLAIALVGITLKATIDFGERRQRFASAVTHELRTPLTTFRMYSEMLADGMVTDADARKQYLETLKEESGRLSTLVENVLSYSRMEKGTLIPHYETLTLAGLWERLRPALERRVAAASMRLSADLAAARDSWIRTDVDVIGQILFNLVDNACKYGRSLTRPEVEIAHRPGTGEIELTVRDHGPGIPGPLATRIFQAFERAGKDHEPIAGIGLGLTLARGLARILGGDLRLDPTVEVGAAFVLTLPACAEQGT